MIQMCVGLTLSLLVTTRIYLTLNPNNAELFYINQEAEGFFNLKKYVMGLQLLYIFYSFSAGTDYRI